MNGVECYDPPPTADTNSDLSLWHHSQRDCKKVPDQVLKSVYDCGSISFVFHQKSHELAKPTKEEKEEEKDEDYDPEEDDDCED